MRRGGRTVGNIFRMNKIMVMKRRRINRMLNSLDDE